MGWNCRCPATTIKKYSKNCGKEAIQQEIRLIQFPFGNLPNAGPRIDPVDFLCRLDLTYWTYWDAASCHVVSIYESEYLWGTNPYPTKRVKENHRLKIDFFEGICYFRRVWIKMIKQNTHLTKSNQGLGSSLPLLSIICPSESESMDFPQVHNPVRATENSWIGRRSHNQHNTVDVWFLMGTV